MTVAQKQDAIATSINELGDCFEQYSYLIFRAGNFPTMSSEYKTNEYLVRGCQSIVWIKLDVLDGVMYMQADSDTLIIKGILGILTDLVDGANIAEIAATPIDVLERTSLASTFESARLTGIKTILKKIASMAEEALSREPNH